MSELLKKCSNIGCQRLYREEENDGITDQCVYHSGEAFFHDAYKGWKCCQQKSTDFTTFLNFKGCTKGKHSDVKREVISSQNKTNELNEEIIDKKEEKEEKEKPIEEIDENVWKSLEICEMKGVSEAILSEEKVNIFCKKCRKRDESEECVFHSGEVIFHDSLKYWTCCERKKFTDFDDFHALKGCQKSDKHEMALEVKKPREDWFQTETEVHLVLYGLKGVRSLHSLVETNQKLLKVCFKDSKGIELFTNEWNLKEFVSKELSRVFIFTTKVEIVLKKVYKNKFWNSIVV